MPDRDLTGLRILVVEDNFHFRKLLVTILDHIGVKEVREADEGREGLRILGDFAADLAIIDWKMDGMDGLECVRRIRRGGNGGARRIPVLMVTGYGDDEMADRARDAGANDLLVKPISPRSLMRHLNGVLDRPGAFIETDAYVGPDRRRLAAEFDGGERRDAETGALLVREREGDGCAM